MVGSEITVALKSRIGGLYLNRIHHNKGRLARICLTTQLGEYVRLLVSEARHSLMHAN